MDERLVAWARAVKSRHRDPIPPLWLFTDPVRMPDLVAVVRGLPRGLCGVVFRHDGVAGRAGLGRAVLRVCRDRRLWMVSAGPPVPGAGTHLRGGRLSRMPARHPRTASAHDGAQLRLARRAAAAAVFLSPAFPTGSHPGTPAMTPARWAALARRRGAVFALGGITGRTVLRLPRWCRGVGAIRALSG